MIVLSGALVLVALVLLVFGALDRNLPYVYASIGVSVLSLLLLLVGILQRRGELAGDEQDDAATPVTDTSAERVPAHVPSGAEHAQVDAGTAELARPAPEQTASRRVVPDAAPVEDVRGEEHEHDDVEFDDDDDVEDDDAHAFDDDDDDDELEDEPEDEPEDEGSGVTVLVVHGRPRYHLEGCRVLRGREPEPLDRDDARGHGFSPCGVCKPDADELEPQPAAAQTDEGASFTETLFGGPLFADDAPAADGRAADASDAPADDDRAPDARTGGAATGDTPDVEPPATGVERPGVPAADAALSGAASAEDPAAEDPAAEGPDPEGRAPEADRVGTSALPDRPVQPVLVEVDRALPEADTQQPDLEPPAELRGEDPADDPSVAVHDGPAVPAPDVAADPDEPADEPAQAGAAALTAASTDEVRAAPPAQSSAAPESAPVRKRASTRTTAKASRTAEVGDASADEDVPPAKPAKRAPAKRASAKTAPAQATSPRTAPTKAGAKEAAAKAAPPETAPAAPQVKRPLVRAVRPDALRLGAPSTGGTTTRVAARGAAPSTAAPVVVVPDRDRFHRPACRFVRDAPGATTLSKASATRQGYAACGVCKP